SRFQHCSTRRGCQRRQSRSVQNGPVLASAAPPFYRWDLRLGSLWPHSCKAVAHGFWSAVILRNSDPARLLRPGTAIVAPIAAADFIAPPAVSPTDGAANVPLRLTIVGISVSPRPLVTTGVTA